MKTTIALLVLSVLGSVAPAFAATAMFTGQQELVTTVTYQTAWRCQYQYMGNYFWRIFKGSCPYSVEVE